MKRQLTSIIISLIAYSINCQDTSRIQDTLGNNIRKNSIFFEIVGNSSFYSLNYERLFTKYDNSGIGIRIGYSYVNISFAALEKYYILPVEMNYIHGEQHCLEVGCGLELLKHVTEYKTEHSNIFSLN